MSFGALKYRKLVCFEGYTTSVNWDFGRGPEYESSLDPQARELVGYWTWLEKRWGLGGVKVLAMAAPSPRLFTKMTNVNATHLIGDI